MGITDYDWSLVWDYRGDLLRGLLTALEVSVVALVIATVGGLGLAILRMGKAPMSWIAAIYINVFRGMPALVTVIWIYFGVSLLLGVNFSVFQAGVIALSLLYSAFMAEIFRAALQAVPHGHREAGQALGMRDARIFSSVVAPQAFKIALPNIGSMFIGMIKDTSTFTVIGLLEVVRVTQNVNAQTFQPFVLYTAAAAIYVLAAFGVDLLFRLLEASLSSPPKGGVSKLLRGRKQRRIQALITELAA
ncbi:MULTISPECIES: amino acid ABC transporter permease [unclassified Nocardioides]|uniref:amino acid ABC transporter permease n=1 Tax=unclassified Nocardioides TaxID=2615069 RepID=UPI002665CFE2|nr:amino acid ABC transporter permease [Nocardioides sp. Arc9.136]WKN48504.1 amino acid ABC transporter permease [Nocardioides sp. Arc9.136]